MKEIIPGQIPTAQFHSHLLSSIAPRPIAFVSTIDEEGTPNLSPFSFFNVFGSNPPIAIVSPARRVRDNTTKHSLQNVEVVPELVINVVNYAIVHQASLASVEYPKGVNEFTKSGLTPVASDLVKPFRVKESPVQLECAVQDIIYTGKEGGAGNLIVCKILKMHISPDILDDNGKIDQHKIDLVGRLGGNWYVRANGAALFEFEKPVSSIGIGVDGLPEAIRLSPVLTGSQLGRLGNVTKLPTSNEAQEFVQSAEFELIVKELPPFTHSHQRAAQLIESGQILPALYWLITTV